MQDLKQSLILWNNRFPFDKLFRQKYGIAYGSEEHKKTNQIDVYLDILEDRLFERYREEQIEDSILKENYKKKGFLNEERVIISEEEFSDIFHDLDVTKINKKQEDGE